MVRRVAVLSDVHGVLPVLEAVLAEPDVAGADLVVVTGDHAAGPQPVEVLDRLTALGDRVLLVRGNADRELVALAGGADVDVPDPYGRGDEAAWRNDHNLRGSHTKSALRSRLGQDSVWFVSGWWPSWFWAG